MAAFRYNVFGCIIDIERRGEVWITYAVGNDGKRSPGGFVVPDFVQQHELEQFLFDLFHEQAAFRKGQIFQVR